MSCSNERDPRACSVKLVPSNTEAVKARLKARLQAERREQRGHTLESKRFGLEMGREEMLFSCVCVGDASDAFFDLDTLIALEREAQEEMMAEEEANRVAAVSCSNANEEPSHHQQREDEAMAEDDTFDWEAYYLSLCSSTHDASTRHRGEGGCQYNEEE